MDIMRKSKHAYNEQNFPRSVIDRIENGWTILHSEFPSKTNLFSSDQPRSRLGDISSLCFEYVSDVSRSYFSGACLYRAVATPSPRNKH